MTDEVKQYFIGPFKVLGISKVEGFQTPGGSEVVSVVYEGGFSQLMPLKAYEILRREEITDLTNLSERKLDLIRDAIIAAMMEYDANALEIEMILKKVSDKLTNAYDRAAHYLFTKEVYGEHQDKLWVPGSNFAHYRSVLEVDKVLKGLKQNDAGGNTNS